MRQKLIAIDIDGTLINPQNGEIPPRTRTALKKLKERHILTLASGRPPAILNGLDLELGFDHVVLANGRYVKSRGDILRNEALDKAIIQTIVQDVVSQGYDVGYEGEFDFVLGSHQSAYVDKFHHHWQLDIPSVDANYFHHQPVLQLIVYAPAELKEVFQAAYPSVQFTPSCAYGFDVNVKGGLKEEGVALLAAHLGFEPKDVVAIGDGLNDLGLLAYAGLSIAMGQAPQVLKDAATYVSASVDEDGFYKAFEHLKFWR